MTDKVKCATVKIEKLFPSLLAAATIHMDEATKQSLESTALNMGKSAASVVDTEVFALLLHFIFQNIIYKK